ncbi:putative F-box domain-containing protein [Medicago truncatula]|uniref:F-box-like protein n=1 Tax=Medicago truncatula TaxID=3880 RepID=G7JZA4_MEDTR|nr:F-box-like protein [Medicago truncatula]RHN55679.1 putative F-box domain-containing protein [Medicago truncatula]
MAVSPISVLPDELLMEILSRVDSSNHLDLRCVCNLWKSLIRDPQFMKNHILRSITGFSSLSYKIEGHFIAFKSHIVYNPPLVPNVEEDVDVDVDVDVDGADSGEGEGEGEGEGDDDDDDDEDDDEEDEEVLRWKALIKLSNLERKEEQLKKRKNMDKIDEKTMIIRMAKLDIFLVVVRYMKSFMLNYLKSLEDRDILNENLESLRVEMQTMEDRLMCLKIFIKFYLRAISISMFSLVQPLWNFRLGD